MKKIFIRVAPYIAILAAFIVYMEYWSEVTRQCVSICNRGYDDGPYYADFIGLINGTWPDNVVFYQSPVPGFFLGLTYKIFQFPIDNLAIPYLLQIYFATLTCALIYKLARWMFSRPVALITVLFLGFYGFVKFYATTLEANTLIAFFLTATFYFLVKYRLHEKKSFLIIASICLGLAALSRTNNLVLIGAVTFWFILLKIPFKKLIVNLSVLLAVTSLVLLPAVLHSSLAAEKFVPVTSTGVYNFTMGNLPDSPGYYADIATHSLGPSIEFITEQPIDWLLLTLRKFQLFFTFPWSPARLTELPSTFVLILIVIIILYFYYFVKSFSPQRSLLHLSLMFYTGSIVITHVEDEYRTPILPLIFLFLSVVLLNLIGQLYKIQRKFRQKIVQWQAQKPAVVFMGSLSLIGFFALYVPSAQTFHQVETIKSDPAYGGVIVGQNFKINCPNLNRIEIKLFSPIPNNQFTFHLRENSVKGPEIYTQVINTSQIASFDYYPITFPEVSNSTGKNYVFYFDTSNLKSPAEGIIFAGGQHPFAQSLNRINVTKRFTGEAFISLDNSFANLDSLDGNLIFSAHCNANQLQLIKAATDKLTERFPLIQGIQPLLVAIFIASPFALFISTLIIIYKGISNEKNAVISLSKNDKDLHYTNW